ncbi:secreted protein [gut metagenome]|uniref:Secreted protein n=1 Tax=gut metagenome TaxID=749906 RepID=J9C8H7_9ZZZZ
MKEKGKRILAILGILCFCWPPVSPWSLPLKAGKMGAHGLRLPWPLQCLFLCWPMP